MNNRLVVTEWFEPVSIRSKDPVFYCWGGTSPVGQVKLVNDGESELVIRIFCDGEMKATHLETGKIYRYTSDFLEDGYDTDEKLFSSDDFDWDMNPWFDLYTEAGESLEYTSHDLFEVQAYAEQIILEEFQLHT